MIGAEMASRASSSRPVGPGVISFTRLSIVTFSTFLPGFLGATALSWPPSGPAVASPWLTRMARSASRSCVLSYSSVHGRKATPRASHERQLDALRDPIDARDENPKPLPRAIAPAGLLAAQGQPNG